METLLDSKVKKEEITKEAKILVVTTAVSQYLTKKQQIAGQKGKISPWVLAARQDSMKEGNLGE